MSLPSISPIGVSAAPVPFTGETLRPSGGAKADEVRRAAQQFEAILIRQLIAPAIQPLASAGGSDQAGGVYGFMLTDVLSNAMSQGGGLGLSKVLTKQLAPAPATSLPAAAPRLP